MRLILTISCKLYWFNNVCSKFLEVYTQHGIKTTGIAPSLVRQDVWQLQNIHHLALLFSLRNFMKISSLFLFQTTITMKKCKTAIATNIFIMVYKKQIFEHLYIYIFSKVADQWPLPFWKWHSSIGALQVKPSKLFFWISLILLKCCVWYSYLTPKTPFLGNEITSLARRFQLFGHRFQKKYFWGIWLRLFPDCFSLGKEWLWFWRNWFLRAFAFIV